MKNINSKKIAVTFFVGMSALFQSQAFAQGGTSGVGGGGSAIILPDDQVVLADPFVAKTQQTATRFRFQLPAEVVEETRIALQSTAVYEGKPYPSLTNEFIRRYISGSEIEYYAVDRIPRNCPYQLPELLHLPDGSKVTAVACTFENKTYIIKSIFEKMAIREQAKLIIHEALRRIRVISTDENADQFIAQITSGMDLLLQLSDNERKGILNELTDSQVTQIQQMIATVRQLKLLDIKDLMQNDGTYIGARNNFIKMRERISEAEVDAYVNPFFSVDASTYEIRKKGGAFVHKKAQIDPSAYLGVGQLFNEKTVIGKNSVIMQSSPQICAGECVIEEGVRVQSVTLAGDLNLPEKLNRVTTFASRFLLKKNTSLVHVGLRGIGVLALEEGSSITQTSIVQNSIKLGWVHTEGLFLSAGAKISNVRVLYLKTGSNILDIAWMVSMPVTFATYGLMDKVKSYWWFSNLQLDGSKPSPCQSGEYFFMTRSANVGISDEASLSNVCMSPSKIK